MRFVHDPDETFLIAPPFWRNLFKQAGSKCFSGKFRVKVYKKLSTRKIIPDFINEVLSGGIIKNIEDSIQGLFFPYGKNVHSS